MAASEREERVICVCVRVCCEKYRPGKIYRSLFRRKPLIL